MVDTANTALEIIWWEIELLYSTNQSVEKKEISVSIQKLIYNFYFLLFVKMIESFGSTWLDFVYNKKI